MDLRPHKPLESPNYLITQLLNYLITSSETEPPMHRILALIERDLRRFRRSPTLIIVSMVMPLVQLVVLGYAFGGVIKNLRVGVVDQDHGQAAIQLKERFGAIAANA